MGSRPPQTLGPNCSGANCLWGRVRPLERVRGGAFEIDAHEVRPPMGGVLTNVRCTSTPDVQSLGTSVARRVDLTRSKLLSGTVGPGAILRCANDSFAQEFRPFK